MNTAAAAPVTGRIVADVIRWGEAQLRAQGSGRLDAELLLAHALNTQRIALYRDSDRELAHAQVEAYRALVVARVSGRPVAQLTGTAEFWSLQLSINEHVLVPRPETETLVAATLTATADLARPAIADLGTGSGAIALALATERPAAGILATDISRHALALAQANCVRHGAHNVTFAASRWLQAVASARFDAIASNPPYVAAADPALTGDGLRFEPRLALDGGDDGLSALREIAAAAPACLRAGGVLLVEHGCSQGAAVRELFERAGFAHVRTERDLAGLDRVTVGCYR